MSNLNIQLKTYLFTYHHEGAEWLLELKAADERDARARCAKLAFARLDGELVTKVPLALAWPARISVMLHNLLKAIKTPSN